MPTLAGPSKRLQQLTYYNGPQRRAANTNYAITRLKMLTARIFSVGGE